MMDRVIRRTLNPRYSFAARMGLVSFALSLVSMVALSILAGNMAERRLEEESSRALLAIGRETIAADIRTNFLEALSDLGLLAAEIENQDESRWSDTLRPFKATEPRTSWVAIFDSEGKPHASAGEPVVFQGRKTWFAAARQRPTISREPDTATTVVALPIRFDRPRFEGVIALGMQQLHSDKTTLLLAHDEAQMAIVGWNGSLITGSPAVAALAPQLSRESVSQQSAPNAARYLVAVIPMTDQPTVSLQWSVVLAAPTDVAFAAAREIQRAVILWGFVASLMSAVIQWFATRWSVLPLRQLATMAQSLEHVRAFRSVPFTHRKDEIGRLAQAWSMLLGRIAENSDQLASTNRDLTRAITESRAAEQRAQKSEEQYREIFEAVFEALLIFDAQGIIVAANRSACDLYGYSHEELLGRDEAGLIETGLPNAHSFLREVEAGPFYAEGTGLRSDGTRVAIAVRGRTFEYAGQRHALALVRSIDEEKRLYRQLEQTMRMDSLGRLAATIAHEINNVLMGIMPFAEIIGRRPHADTLSKNAATHIIRSIERGRRITQEVLRFTRATEPVMRSFEAKEWLSHLAPHLSAILGNSVQLTLTCRDDGNLLLFGDRVQLEQVLTNLAVNAHDAMRGKGEFRVEIVPASPLTRRLFAGVDRLEDFVHMTVADTGPGIPSAIQPHIFEPLFTTKGGSGTGLGLAVVHQIIAQHGGQICVESSEGKGAVFHVLLPRGTAITKSPGERPALHVSAQRVLVVEDEESVAAGLVALLDVEGFTTHHVAQGAEVLAASRSFRPDVIILDIGLPDISGIEVYRRLKEAGYSIPTIFSTGHGDEDALSSVVERDRVAFLLKPYDFEQLRKAMGEVLEA